MGLIVFLFTLPYFIFFFAFWTLASLVMPICFLTLVCVASNPAAAYRKFEIFVATIQYLIFCNDKKWKTPEDPAPFFQNKDKEKIESKTIVFVRHGESTWNDTFNKGDRPTAQFIKGFIPGLIKAVFNEWYFWVSAQANESWFFDAPLSEKGLQQALAVQKFLQSDPQFLPPKERKFMHLLNSTDEAQLVSSNLRRAISTMVIGFQDRLTKDVPKDQILILPALQEISRNPDALTITPAYGKVVPAWTDPKIVHTIYEHRKIDTKLHSGNKHVSSNGLQRLQEFCEIAFETIEKESIICGGHSLWFRSFFQTFLPSTFEHVSKKKKLVNGGIVGFTLQRTKTESGRYQYMIDPTSITILHGGF